MYAPGPPTCRFALAVQLMYRENCEKKKGRVRRLDVRRYVCERRREKRSLQFWDGVESLVAMFC